MKTKRYSLMENAPSVMSTDIQIIGIAIGIKLTFIIVGYIYFKLFNDES